MADMLGCFSIFQESDQLSVGHHSLLASLQFYKDLYNSILYNVDIMIVKDLD